MQKTTIKHRQRNCHFSLQDGPFPSLPDFKDVAPLLQKMAMNHRKRNSYFSLWANLVWTKLQREKITKKQNFKETKL